ncbi:MAG: ribose-phosphate pyrophosphokinase [Dehalococcoidia bacterium]|nr:MAG: ribose-phosphate pyrophosphokinase [Dehalococcoidia bacterium]
MSREIALFSGRAHLALAEAICQELRLPLGQRQLFDFTNGQTFVKYEQLVRDRDVFIVQPGAALPNGSVNDAIMELLIMIEAARRASAWRVTAVIPYFAYARTDKKDQPRVPITARLIADLLVAAGVNRVLTLDLHAGQIQGFFPATVPVDEVTAFHLICNYVASRQWENLVVVATDLGFAKRAKNFAQVLGTPVAFVAKSRLGNTDVTEADHLIGDVRGMRALVVDDEIDTAGSITAAAQLCIEHGAIEVYAAATHGLFSGRAVERIRESPIRELIVTDSLPQHVVTQRLPQVTVLPVARLMAEAIYRIHEGESIGALYQALYGDRVPVS